MNDSLRKVVCALVLFSAGASPACKGRLASRPGPDAVAVSPFDSVIFATAATAVTRAPDVDRVWPGFWNPPTFALYRRDTAVFLYTVDTPPVEFHVVQHVRLPAVLAGRLFFHEGSWPGLRGGVLPIDSKAVRLAMAVAVANRSTSQLEFLFHESFHGWQARNFQHLFDPDVPQALPENVRLPRDLAGRLEIERRLLAAALDARRPDERAEHVRDYLAARRARFAGGDRLAEQIEQAQERLEGTAEYVGLSGSLAATNSQYFLRDSISARLSADRRWGPPSATPRQRLRDRTYVSGSAMAYLLDQLHCAFWRVRTIAGEFLDAQLASCLRSSNA